MSKKTATTRTCSSSAALVVGNSKDLVGEILSRLPLSCVIRCRLVCKEWCSLTSTQSFIDMHQNINQPSPSSCCFVVQYFNNRTKHFDSCSPSKSSSDHFNTLFFNLDDNNDNNNNNNMKKKKKMEMNIKMKMVREYIDLSSIFSRGGGGGGRGGETIYYRRTNFFHKKTYYHVKLISSYRGFLLFTAKPAANYMSSVSHRLRSWLTKDDNDEDPALIFYNPVTKEQYTVAAPPSTHVYCGFYYHSPTKEYRILYQLMFDDHEYKAGVVKFLVFGLQTQVTRILKLKQQVTSTDSSPFIKSAAYYYHPDPSTPPVISNGSLHWIVSEDDHHGHFHDPHFQIPNCSQTIVSFDMESEEFHRMPHPPLSHPCVPRGHILTWGRKYHRHQMNLLEMEGGILCLCDGHGRTCDRYGSHMHILEIYVMEDYKKWTWVRRYRIDLSGYIGSRYDEYGLHYNALHILQGDQLLLHYHSYLEFYEEYAFYSLNPLSSSTAGMVRESNINYNNKKIDFKGKLECTFTDKNKYKRHHFQVVIDQYPVLGRLRRMMIKPNKRRKQVRGNMVVLTPSLASFQHNRSAPGNDTFFSIRTNCGYDL